MLHYFTTIRLLSLLLIWIGAAIPALAQPVEVRSDHFVLLSEAQVDAQALLSDLEQTMTELMAGHFRIAERKIKLSRSEKDDLLYRMIDGPEHPVERPVQRPKKPA